MATSKINKNCHYVQNDPHKCKIKLEKVHFDIWCRFGVIKESEIGLNLGKCKKCQNYGFFVGRLT